MKPSSGQALQMRGFSLIELLVVLSLFAMGISLAPAGLERLYSSSSLDAYVQEVSAQLRDCALTARRTGRNLRLELSPSGDCSIEPSSKINIGLPGLVPVFYSDGTSNGQSLVLRAKDKSASLYIDKLNSKIRVTKDAS